MGDNIKLWLYRAADNQIKAYIRKNPSFQPIDELSELAAVSEISEITDSAFDFLTPEELALITEYYDGDKAAAARKNNISMNGLYIRIHRIKKKLLDSAVRMNKINK
jgi:DNA-directed RNA polymerase specialized sigma24 family protein